MTLLPVDIVPVVAELASGRAAGFTWKPYRVPTGQQGILSAIRALELTMARLPVVAVSTVFFLRPPDASA